MIDPDGPTAYDWAVSFILQSPSGVLPFDSVLLVLSSCRGIFVGTIICFLFRKVQGTYIGIASKRGDTVVITPGCPFVEL